MLCVASRFCSAGGWREFCEPLGLFPFLIVVSQYKLVITGAALLMIVIAGYVNYKTYYMPCPIDPEEGRACAQTRKNSRIIYYVSVAIFSFATVFTYIVPRFI